MLKGTSLLARATPDAIERFWSKVDMSGDCWLWLGSPTPAGYGMFRIGYSRTGAHRFSYEITHGRIPEGWVIDHLCRNPLCVRPDHLEAVSQRVNFQRGMHPSGIAYRTGICHDGHSLRDPANIWIGPTGERKCRSCGQANRRARYQDDKRRLGIPDRQSRGTCTREDCDGPHYGRGLCKRHYEAERRRAARAA